MIILAAKGPVIGLGAAEAAAAVAGLVGLQVSLVVLVELDFAGGGEPDAFLVPLWVFILGTGCLLCFTAESADGARSRGALRGRMARL